MKNKIVSIIIVIVCVACEIIGFYYATNYRRLFLNGSPGYKGEVVNVYDNYVTIKCIENNFCIQNGDYSVIKVDVPNDVKLSPGEKIYFYYYKEYAKVESFYYNTCAKIDFIIKYTPFFTGFPVGTLFIYFFYYIMFRKKENIIYRLLPIISAILFSGGMLLTYITEEDGVQFLGMLGILLSLVSPWLIDKKIFKNK